MVIIRRLFTIHIRNQFSGNSTPKTEGQKMSQGSTNQKIYNSIQRKQIKWEQNLMEERDRDINTQSQNSKRGSDQDKYLTVDKRKSQEIYVYVIEGQNLTQRFSLGKTQDIVSLHPNSQNLSSSFLLKY